MFNREGVKMTNSVSNTNIRTTAAAQNPASFTLPLKRVVVNPPSNFYKFSVRDVSKLDSDLSRNYMNIMLSSLHNSPFQPTKTNTRQNFLLTTALLCGGMALLCRKDSVITYSKKIFEILKYKIPCLKGKF